MLNTNELMQEIEKLSAAEREAILNTQFPEELEKEANAALAQNEVAEGLYALGALAAERQLAEVDGVEKIAQEDLDAHNSFEAAVEAELEKAMETAGVAEIEDTIELHKEAQAAAGILFQGYADTMEKAAAEGMLPQIKAHGKKALEAMKGAGKKVMKHKGKAGLAAGLVGGYYGKKAMDKKASEMTAIEMRIFNDQIDELESGVEKLAAKGSAMGSKMRHLLNKAKRAAIKHRGALGLAGGAAAGAGAEHAMKDKK